MKPYHSKSGFTLIELILVVLIIAVIASIAVPGMQTMKNRAILSEAVSALGTLRTAMRAYHAVNGVYPTTPPGSLVSDGFYPALDPGLLQELAIDPNAFNGRYFPAKAYYISSDSSTFIAGCFLKAFSYWFVDDPDAKAVADATGICSRVTMDQDGNVLSQGLINPGF